MAIIPAVRDGYDANPIVRKAVEALAAFGGEMSHRQARTLLPLWQHHADLTADERRAVLARFARSCHDIEDPGNSGPGF